MFVEFIIFCHILNFQVLPTATMQHQSDNISHAPADLKATMMLFEQTTIKHVQAHFIYLHNTV